MISPELLRHYQFFANFSDAQLKEVAAISDEASAEAGVTLFEECDLAESLFVLMEGNVDLYFRVREAYSSKPGKEFLTGEINPGEPFAISSVIEPYELSTSGRTSKPSRFIRIDAIELRKLMEKDPLLACVVARQATKVLMERLAYTRVQLAAAWA
jgi:CRP-like cAMP-binding protein